MTEGGGVVGDLSGSMYSPSSFIWSVVASLRGAGVSEEGGE